MKKTIKILLILVIIIILAVLAFIFWSSKPVDDEQNGNGDIVIDNGNRKINTSDWLTYRNEEYGFSFKYPESYEKDSEYHIWTANNTNTGLLTEWGVNKYQQTLFVVLVYPKEKKQELIDSKQIELLGRQVNFLDFDLNFEAEGIKYLSFEGLLTEKDEYIYIIASHYTDYYYSEYYDFRDEHKEFSSIMSTFKFIK